MQSMGEIYQEYAGMVYRYLLSKTHNEDLAEELTQETFYQALRTIHRFDGSCKISTWLSAVAKHQLLVWQRKNPPMETEESICKVLDSAETEALKNEEHVAFMRQLHLCPEPFREVLYLRIFGNLSFREIGEIMGRTENWARVTFYRGKERLKKGLVDDEK